MARVAAHWHEIPSDGAFDVALVQEAVPPPDELALETFPSDDRWLTAGGVRRFCTAVARLSTRVELRQIVTKPLANAGLDELGVSLPGTLAACEVTQKTGERIIVASMYAAWASPVPWKATNWIYADASVHRLISDLSALVASQRGHRIIVAGDLNILHGYGERGSVYWKERYQTVFTRMAAIGLPFIGPQYPDGERCSPGPAELPGDSTNVPTFRPRMNEPGTATRQLDFVFASKDLANRVRVRARNAVTEWGPSDHCRLEIELEPEASGRTPEAEDSK